MEKFKPSIRYGLIMGFIGLVIFLLVWAMAPDMFASWKWMLTQFVVVFLALPIVFQILGARDSKQNFEEYPYGKAFMGAFTVGIIAVLMSVIFNVLFMTVIDPGFNDRVQEQATTMVIEQLENSGMDKAQIDEQLEKMEQRFENQKGIAGQLKNSFFLLIWYAILAAIIAIVYRDKKDKLELN